MEIVHPLVTQLRFTRSEWLRALEGISDDEARRRFPPLNSISWIVGHMAWQEHRYWIERGQGRVLLPDLAALVGHRSPATTPPLPQMLSAWRTATQEADAYLDSLTTEVLQRFLIVGGQPHVESVGTMLCRMIYHYWYHIGESQAVRQLLGHTDLPEFVGDIGGEAPYRPEESALQRV